MTLRRAPNRGKEYAQLTKYEPDDDDYRLGKKIPT
jgi:hypothetical protein